MVDRVEVMEVKNVKRLHNTVNGGPRYLVTFADGTTANTKPDTQFAIALNPEIRGKVKVTFTNTGRIQDMESV